MVSLISEPAPNVERLYRVYRRRKEGILSQDVRITVGISSAQQKHVCQKCEDHAASVLKPTRQEVDQGEDHSAVGRMWAKADI